MSRMLTLVLMLACPVLSAAAEDDLGDPPCTGVIVSALLVTEAVWGVSVAVVLLADNESAAQMAVTTGLAAGPLASHVIGRANDWRGSLGWSVVGSLGGALGGAFTGLLLATDADTEAVAVPLGVVLGSGLGATLGWWAGADPTETYRARWRAEQRALRVRPSERDAPPPEAVRPAPIIIPPPPPVVPYFGALPDADGRLVPGLGLGGRF